MDSSALQPGSKGRRRRREARPEQARRRLSPKVERGIALALLALGSVAVVAVLTVALVSLIRGGAIRPARGAAVSAAPQAEGGPVSWCEQTYSDPYKVGAMSQKSRADLLARIVGKTFVLDGQVVEARRTDKGVVLHVQPRPNRTRIACMTERPVAVAMSAGDAARALRSPKDAYVSITAAFAGWEGISDDASATFTGGRLLNTPDVIGAGSQPSLTRRAPAPGAPATGSAPRR